MPRLYFLYNLDNFRQVCCCLHSDTLHGVMRSVIILNNTCNRSPPLVKYKKQIFPRWTVVDCFKAMFTCYGSAVRSECVKAEEGSSCALPLLVCKGLDLMAKYPCVLDAYRLDYMRQMPSPVDTDAQLPALLWEQRTGLMEDLPPWVSAQLQRWPASGAVGSPETQLCKGGWISEGSMDGEPSTQKCKTLHWYLLSS